jgi:hypothetical protein
VTDNTPQRLSPCAIGACFVAFTIFYPTQGMSQNTLYPDFAHKGKPTLLHGQSGDSCGTFIAEKQPDGHQTSIHAQEMAWVLGFLHGIDAWNPYDTKPYDCNGLDLWLEEYCRKHPIDLLANAANAFYSQIGGRIPMSSDITMWQHYPDYAPHQP